MKISEAEVRYVAKLANLELTDEEVLQFTSQLSDILDHMEVLKSVGTNDIEPMTQVIDPQLTSTYSSPVRPDIPAKPLGAEAALSNAPEIGAQHFKVPKVIAER